MTRRPAFSWRRLCRVAVPACLVAGLLAGGAVPASARNGFDLSFHLAASHGYEVTVGGYGATAVIEVAKREGSPPRRSEWSTYVARGTVSRSAIQADFGALGSARMHFQPSGEVVHGRRHHGCIGPDRYTIRPGAFVGSVRFRGEGGYTSVDVHRVTGKEITPRQLLCPDVLAEQIQGNGTGARGVGAKPTKFQAFLRSGLTAIAFSAERRGRAAFLAESEQSIGRVGVVRGVFVRASPATFASDSALSFAGFTPPAPFSGSASFQRSPEGHKDWTGSLAVSFPGAPNVPLTGPEYRTQLTRGW